MDLLTVKKFLEQNEVFSIDVRYNNGEDSWDGFSFPVSSFDLGCLDNNWVIEDILIKAIDKKNSFMDPFLAHKTLVFLASYEIIDINSNLKSLFNNIQHIGFNLYDKKKDVKVLAGYHMPPYDSNRDIRTEIVMALEDLNVRVLYHYYCGEDNKHFIVINKDESTKTNDDNIRKVKYASKMVAKAYNLENYLGGFTLS